MDAEAVLPKLLAYCRANDWAGYDPYDALNSRIFDAVPLLNNWLPRLALTQTLKRSPVNLRRLLLVPKTHNPKALALFLSAFLRRPREDQGDAAADMERIVERIAALRSPGVRYWCWGYSFPWQTRTRLVPAGAPNAVCTSFVAGALLDLYEQYGDSRYLGMATSAADYLLDELYWQDGDSTGFAYPLPSIRVPVHNANFLAAALLCRTYRHTGERRFLTPALNAARYSAARQRGDGAWAYGEGPSQQWIDNFHTGYNLCALQSIAGEIGTPEFSANVSRGFEFYRTHFFRDDGAPRYFHDRTYPVDIHCVAQSIITLVTLQHLDAGALRLARAVYQWALSHMWSDKGFFYYRTLRFGTIRTSYMRWSQAWMALAITMLLYDESNGKPACVSPRQATVEF